MSLKRLKLKLKEKANKPKRLILKSTDNFNFYYNGYCITDNKNFALFGVSSQFLIDNHIEDVLNFSLTENDLLMLINRNYEIQPIINETEIIFPLFGTLDRSYYNYVLWFNKSHLYFYPVTEWFGKPANTLIVCLPDRHGKPLGVFKVNTIKEAKLE